jgi:hypothetical protein
MVHLREDRQAEAWAIARLNSPCSAKKAFGQRRKSPPVADALLADTKVIAQKVEAIAGHIDNTRFRRV